MEHNLFEELQAKKQQLIAFATKAVKYGWIPETKEEATNKGIISLEEIKEKTEKDTNHWCNWTDEMWEIYLPKFICF